MEAITKATGSTTLSCEHSFHFRCIDSWFTKQINDDNAQTCPCCRNGGCEMDRCSVMEMAEVEEEDDDETYADAESEAATDMPDEEEFQDLRWERLGAGRWIITTSHELAMEGVRNLFGPMNELEVEQETSQEVAARKIQAIFRGHRQRSTFKAVTSLMQLVTLPYQF